MSVETNVALKIPDKNPKRKQLPNIYASSNATDATTVVCTVAQMDDSHSSNTDADIISKGDDGKTSQVCEDDVLTNTKVCDIFVSTGCKEEDHANIKGPADSSLNDNDAEEDDIDTSLGIIEDDPCLGGSPQITWTEALQSMVEVTAIEAEPQEEAMPGQKPYQSIIEPICAGVNEASEPPHQEEPLHPVVEIALNEVKDKGSSMIQAETLQCGDEKTVSGIQETAALSKEVAKSNLMQHEKRVHQRCCLSNTT